MSYNICIFVTNCNKSMTKKPITDCTQHRVTLCRVEKEIVEQLQYEFRKDTGVSISIPHAIKKIIRAYDMGVGKSHIEK